ncbi:MAG: hypothetical protein Kow0069_00200 [Promethearchaeota archaeon]
MEFPAQVKRTLRDLFDQTLNDLCTRYQHVPGLPERSVLHKQRQVRSRLNAILVKIDHFLEEENVDLRSEEFLVFLFDSFYRQLKQIGVFP